MLPTIIIATVLLAVAGLVLFVVWDLSRGEYRDPVTGCKCPPTGKAVAPPTIVTSGRDEFVSRMADSTVRITKDCITLEVSGNRLDLTSHNPLEDARDSE